MESSRIFVPCNYLTQGDLANSLRSMAKRERGRFGANLLQMRLKTGLTQVELARRLRIKQDRISKWEYAELADPGTIVRLAAKLNGRTSQLLDGVITPYDLLRKDLPLPARGKPPSGTRPVKSVRAG